MTFSACYFHAVWTTKYREPLLTSDVERLVFRVIAEKSIELECKVATINGIEDHIHVAVKRPPKIAPAEWVRNVKGASAHEVNTHFPNLPTYFRWQKHYGMLTVGVRHLHIVIDYIRKQKEHHANGTTIASLERTGEDDD